MTGTAPARNPAIFLDDRVVDLIYIEIRCFRGHREPPLSERELALRVAPKERVSLDLVPLEPL